MAEIGSALNLEHIYDESGIIIQDSEFTENVASQSSLIYLSDSNMQVTNSIFKDNLANVETHGFTLSRSSTLSVERSVISMTPNQDLRRLQKDN